MSSTSHLTIRFPALLCALVALLLAPLASAQPVDDGEEAPPEQDVPPPADDDGEPGDEDPENAPPPVDAEDVLPPEKPPEPPPQPVDLPLTDRETVCDDRIDNDGDTVVDCGDADCMDTPACQPTGVKENTNALCSDWIDNDGNGAFDCDDEACAGTKVCQGSFTAPGANVETNPNYLNVPEMDEGMSVEELIGRFGDNDGERNDYTCSDGVDNDNDGRVDCADIGCRFDSNVTVCTAQPGFRFSVVGQVQQTFRLEDTNAAELDQNDLDTQFSLLQLRFLGPIGNIRNSFFLLSTRWEKSPRLTFAMFQLPIGDRGHYFNINSGGGGLTSQLIVSASKHLLMGPAFFVYSAFEQGNGAALEIGGPIDNTGKVHFRGFAAGGAGTFAGNVGGRFFRDDNTNYTWNAGGQVMLQLAGFWSRFDSPFIYTPNPLKLAIIAGGKYDQRAQERYPAWNGTLLFSWWHFFAMGETYWKRELEFESWQYSYLAQIGALVIPKHLFVAAEFGEYIAGDLDNPPDNINTLVGADLRNQRDERQFRAAIHWYAYEQIGRISARYTFRDVKDGRFTENGFREQDISLFGTYRF